MKAEPRSPSMVLCCIRVVASRCTEGKLQSGTHFTSCRRFWKYARAPSFQLRKKHRSKEPFCLNISRIQSVGYVWAASTIFIKAAKQILIEAKNMISLESCVSGVGITSFGANLIRVSSLKNLFRTGLSYRLPCLTLYILHEVRAVRNLKTHRKSGWISNTSWKMTTSCSVNFQRKRHKIWPRGANV